MNNNTAETRAQLLEKTGIDFEKYRTETLQNGLSGLISFPSAASFYLIIFPILVLMLGAVASVLVWKYVGIVFAVAIIAMSTFLLPFLGFFGGLLLFSQKVVADVEDLFGASVDILKKVSEDLPNAAQHLPSDKLAQLSFTDILKGVNLVVILPLVIKIISDKIPLVGGRIGALVANFLLKCSSNSAQNSPTASSPSSSPEPSANFLTQYSQKLYQFADSTQKNIDKITQSARSFVIKPLQISVWLLLVVGIVWVLMGFLAFV